MMSRTLQTIIGIGIVVVVGLLTYGYFVEYGPSLEASVQSQSEPQQPFIPVEVKGAGQTWHTAMADTKASSDDSGLITLVSAKSASGYQIVSNPIGCEEGQFYTLQFDADVTEGVLAVGILDAVKNSWVAIKNVQKPSDQLEFKGTADCKVQVIFYDNNSSPGITKATISQVKVSQKTDEK